MAITSPTRFHLQPKCVVCTFEFVEIPAGNFYNHIVQCGFKISRGRLCDLVFQFIQVITDGKFCRNFGNGVTGGLRCQSADERLTLGLISMAMISSVSGFSAN